MRKFKPTLTTVKQYERKAIWLTAQALSHFEKGTLFTSTTSKREVLSNGVVARYDVPGKFVLDENLTGKALKTQARISVVQSPGSGALGVVVRAGRNYLITLFCNKQENGTYVCEATWEQGKEALGSATYFITVA